MRFNRGVVALAIIALLAMPMHAKPRDEDGWMPSKIVKVIKRLVIKSLGDGLIIPRP